MKKLFTLVLASAAIFVANAQDTSGWKNGQDVTDQLQWKATIADDENIDEPYWQGFQYGQSAPSTWEFRDGSGGERDDYHSWGAYNIPTWNVYQDFEIPAGVYTVKVAGVYREGTTNTTFDKWLAGESTKKAFLYVKVGEEVFESPINYLFYGRQTEALFPYDGWQNDCHFPDKEGVEIYGPSCHWGADKYLENGNWNWNEVLFIVPEKTTIRVGIDKRVEQPQDQVWWNDWRMIYEQPYDESAKALVAYNNFRKVEKTASEFAETVIENYPTLGSIMQDEIFAFGEDHNIKSSSPLADIEAAIAEMEKIDANNHEAYTNTQTMEFVIGVCEGILKVTDFSGKAAFEAAINQAKSVLYDADNTDATVADYLAAADNLNKARITYLLTQPKGDDGGYDFTHAISNPWFVNQEYTPTYNGSVYVFPEPVESAWFGEGSPNDESDLERALDPDGNPAPEQCMPISDKAHWSTSETAEERWIYVDKWEGWHGGMKNAIQKLKGYAGFYSGWAGQASPGGMWVTQVLNDLPEGLYTLEGYVMSNDHDNFATDGNQYMFMNDAEGNELAKVQNTTPKGYWSFYNREGWSKLFADFFYVPGGQVTVGFHHNSMACNAGMVLKYYGKELDYNALITKKIADDKPEEGTLWPGDLATYNEMIAQVKLPVSGMDAYQAASKQVDDASAFKKTAADAVAAYKLADSYQEVITTYEEDAAISEILSVGMTTALVLGEGENDSYKDIETATEVFNAYSSYAHKYAEAETYDSEKIKNLLAAQYEDLKAAPATAEKLVAYESALATPINEIIFEERGSASASVDNPMSITDMLANPTFAEGPKTGWICEGADVNPTINTYGRELAECWNQKPFTISQTLRSLPAGNYEIRVRACYRDASAVDAAMVERAKKGEGQNAFLFAATEGREESTPVVSTAAGEWTTPSFEKWWNANGSEEAKAAGFMADWDGTICILPGEESILNEDDLDTALKEIDLANPAYPFDTKVGDFYYPSSMAGFKYRITTTPDAYVNKVSIYVEEGKDLTLGFKKVDFGGGDWLIYDDFELFYTGNVIPDAINNITVKTAKKGTYNMAGQLVDDSYKGIVIVDGVKKMRK